MIWINEVHKVKWEQKEIIHYCIDKRRRLCWMVAVYKINASFSFCNVLWSAETTINFTALIYTSHIYPEYYLYSCLCDPGYVRIFRREAQNNRSIDVSIQHLLNYLH